MGNSHTQFDISAAVLINKQFSHYVIILHIRTHASTRTDKHTHIHTYLRIYVCMYVVSVICTAAPFVLAQCVLLLSRRAR